MDAHSAEAQRAAIFTLWKNHLTPTKIHEALVAAHQNHAVNICTVRNWIDRFEAGQVELGDQPRSGRPMNPFKKCLNLAGGFVEKASAAPDSDE
jgi:hypothetical protein